MGSWAQTYGETIYPSIFKAEHEHSHPQAMDQAIARG